MSEAEKRYREFTERFAANRGISIKNAELHLIVQEYKKYINKECDNDRQGTYTNSKE